MSRKGFRGTWFHSGLQRAVHVLWPVALLLLDGCHADYYDDELRRLRTELTEQRSAQAAVEGRVRGIEEFLTYCPDEVKRLIGQVDQACASGEYCALTERAIRLQVLDVARWNGGRFLSLMQDRKHVALFLPPDGRELRDVERKQLRDLIEPAWLDDHDRRTRFLVVSHPQGPDTAAMGQAKKRGDYVIREMETIVSKLRPPSVAPAGEAAGEAGQSVPHSAPAGAPATSTSSMRPLTLDANATGSLNSLTPPPAVALPPLSPGGTPSDSAAPSPTLAVPRPRYILHWVFPFYREGEVLRPEDRPPKIELLRSSVFVYRVEC